ncbi:hypothetical protein COT93_03655 [Candidatus Falkowbacteria bacterium CG10_big_fil_rev_8_21_14_0_10_37_18]|uniref:Uncharacterized protein n=1 Tax=Candidatus Falkowbacteria bacterium CG10_big_fil_rev_8_21_14_0_10_37_18 TaxID=1974562 RepID=A0A2H0VA13_9BACT|nr:MAG: hypothetical protein AUJ26_00800 [Candidatus Falkowbacteria bacterium CG1_02_37_21]PIR95209.1 MAG: hypothetical protein COT93_03655 [Candidatus Falkowbacteria bacterium CG10_big_fil_rev_8_21_14_0_10_37_18]
MLNNIVKYEEKGGDNMNLFNANKAGLVVAAIVALKSVSWTILVWSGVAHDLLNWFFSVNFMINPFQIVEWSVTTALIGFVINIIIGYMIGWFFATLANFVRQQ